MPTPRSVLGHDIGEYHTSYLGVMRYVEALAHAVPDPVRLLPIGDNSEPVVAPDLVLRRFLGILDLRLELRAVALVEFPA